MTVKKVDCIDCFGKGFNIRISEQYKAETAQCKTCNGTGKNQIVH